MAEPEMNEEAFRALCDAHLEGTLTPEQHETLSQALRDDPSRRRLFVEYCSLDAGLKLGSGASPFDQLPEELVEELGQAADANPVALPTARGFGFRGWAIAALLMLGLFLFAVMVSRDAEQGVARVIHIEGEARVNQDRNLALGDELFAGDALRMEAGLIELAYRESGVHVLATAPLSAKLESTKRVFLAEGEMKLVVPPQGIGFVVDTPERQITDLGTSFVVKASKAGSRVLVLDGQVAVTGAQGDGKQLMMAGDLAKFGRDGKTQVRSEQHPDIAELSLPSLKPTSASLHGRVLGFEGAPVIPRQRRNQDVIARQVLPLVQSGFQDRGCLEVLKQGAPLRFTGITGNYATFPDRAGLAPYPREFGWLVWYRGQVVAPKPGRYRFWGYADNHLLVAINGKPVFDGSRRDSPFKEVGIARTDHPSYPCLNAMAGFACGSWFELGSDGVQLDIVFGEIMENGTSGLLLVEREGERYEETSWGQPKWPLFLTESPTEDEIAELEKLREQMEAKLMGSFSIGSDAVWGTANE
jgi:ferric-dicitrate binding protein FerR (iron transport regulator)